VFTAFLSSGLRYIAQKTAMLCTVVGSALCAEESLSRFSLHDMDVSHTSALTLTDGVPHKYRVVARLNLILRTNLSPY